VEDSRLRDAWSEAAAELSLRVEQRGDAVLVHDFGSPNGTLCVLLHSEVRHFPATPADDARYFSQLGPSYLKYERALFVDTLNDWGWFGTGSPPPWYTGEPWT
jgi:hypothetical protein